MRNSRIHFPFSLVSFCTGVVGVLLVLYIGLIAVVMSYATVTVEFSHSVRNDEAAVAMLEGRYLANVASITTTDYAIAGYALPIAKIFVPAKSVTALR
ncbi:MAG TPA: hypothetical protein VJI70_01885 [Candidatus Paceibacterota bacterium]